ncbi:N-acetyl-6-hydroxytryptophan oxidase ivoB [Colletotrichum siamense]|nr:N-acetyl-6-hydroxytryptophan oxidase ivoB [Colletotrichum siamense]
MQVTVAFSLALLAGLVHAVPLANNTPSTRHFDGACTANKLTIRKEWRNMNPTEKHDFLDAQNCLMKLPAKTNLGGVTNRFSDLQALHRWLTNATVVEGYLAPSWQGVIPNGIYVADIIHDVGQFFPWHRYYMHAYETMMRDECGYKGTMPWWDEAKDANTGDFFQSEMWSSEWFGGNGIESLDWCVTDGAFANYTEHMGPALTDTTYCMSREWYQDIAQELCTSEVVNKCHALESYEDFYVCAGNAFVSPHYGGHTAVGGIMADIHNSPGDPTFFLHHNYIDRLWWQWQTANAPVRFSDMSGQAFNSTNLEALGQTGPTGGWPNATLDYPLWMADILPNVTISEVMNVQGGLLCYDYDY